MQLQQIEIPDYGHLFMGGNQEANECLKTIGKNLSKSHQLIISGTKGIGKTHLISHWLRNLIKDRTDLNLVYITANKFVEEFVHGLMRKTYYDFKLQLYAADILIIEDIEILQDKCRSSQEVASLVTELTNQNKTVIFTVNQSRNKRVKLPKVIKKSIQTFTFTKVNKPTTDEKEKIVKELISHLDIEEPVSILYYLSRYFGKSINSLKNAVHSFELSNSSKQLTVEWLDNYRLLKVQ